MMTDEHAALLARIAAIRETHDVVVASDGERFMCYRCSLREPGPVALDRAGMKVHVARHVLAGHTVPAEVNAMLELDG